MSIFGRIFATEKAVEKTIDAVTNGIDKIWYTAEEKAGDEAVRQAAKHDAQMKAQGLLLDWVKASSGHNLARRWLTINITSVWLVQMVLGMVFAVAAIWVDDADRVIATAGLLQGYAAEMGNIVLIIILFYFAAPHMGSALDILLSRIGISKGKGAA